MEHTSLDAAHEHEMLDNLIHHIGRFAVAILRRRLDIGAALSDVIADQLEEMIRYAHKQLESCSSRDSDPNPAQANQRRVDPSVDDPRPVDSSLVRTSKPASPVDQARQRVKAAIRFKTAKRRMTRRKRR